MAYMESPGQAEVMERTSPFRNGEMEKMGAKNIYEHETDALLGYVYSRDKREFLIALPCEHIAFANECRFNCDEWKAAVEGFGTLELKEA